MNPFSPTTHVSTKHTKTSKLYSSRYCGIYMYVHLARTKPKHICHPQTWYWRALSTHPHAHSCCDMKSINHSLIWKQWMKIMFVLGIYCDDGNILGTRTRYCIKQQDDLTITDWSYSSLFYSIHLGVLSTKIQLSMVYCIQPNNMNGTYMHTHTHIHKYSAKQ